MGALAAMRDVNDPGRYAQMYGAPSTPGGFGAMQNPSQGIPQTSMLNPYNFNPYQQNQMGGMGYGMMNQIMARLQNPQAMQNPMASPMFTTGAGYQSPMMQPNFNYGVNMNPIGGMASPYSFLAPQQQAAPTSQKPKRTEGGSK